jgi:hypothetical protein
VAKKTSSARTGQRALGGLLTSNATQKEFSCARGPASRPLALVLGGEAEARPMLRSVPAKGGMPDQGRRLASGRFSKYPFCYESHARVRAPADRGTSTRSHGAAPAQECLLRLKRPPPKAAPWFPPLNPRPPTDFGALAPPPFLRRGKRKLALPFWKEKRRSVAHFSLQNGMQKIPGRKGRIRANTAQSRARGMTAV